MSEAKDTLLRLLALLRLIPVEPQRIATTTLQEKLRDRGFSVSLRSVQRDLIRLSGPFPLQCDDSDMPFRWSFGRETPLDLSDMDAPSALALYLSENHLAALLPTSVLDQLGPQFRRARNYLDGLEHNGLANWARRVRAIPNGKALLPAQIAPHVWREVSTALLERRQVWVEYQSRSKARTKRFRIHPSGLVSRHSVSYLVGTSDDYADIRQFAIHRILKAEALDARACQPDDFDLDEYIANGAFSWRTAPNKVELIADVHPQIAWLLSETPIHKEQVLEPLKGSEWYRIKASVSLDQETFWWICGLNEHIRVHKPLIWVNQITSTLKNTLGLYNVSTDK